MPRHRAASAASRMTDEKAEVSTAQVATEARLAQPEPDRVGPSSERRFTVSPRLVSPDRQIARSSSDHGPRIAPESQRKAPQRRSGKPPPGYRRSPAPKVSRSTSDSWTCPLRRCLSIRRLATAQRPFCEDNGVGGTILHAAPFLGVVKQECEIARLPLASTWTCRVIDQFGTSMRAPSPSSVTMSRSMITCSAQMSS